MVIKTETASLCSFGYYSFSSFKTVNPFLLSSGSLYKKYQAFPPRPTKTVPFVILFYITPNNFTLQAAHLGSQSTPWLRH